LLSCPENAIGPWSTETQGFELSPEARAQSDLKFTYVVTCQIYGKQREEQKAEATDIALLMQRYVCYISIENLSATCTTEQIK